MHMERSLGAREPAENRGFFYMMEEGRKIWEAEIRFLLDFWSILRMRAINSSEQLDSYSTVPLSVSFQYS